MVRIEFAYRIIISRLHLNLFKWQGRKVQFAVQLVKKEKKLPHLIVRTREELQDELRRVLQKNKLPSR
jgi:hypothetical protein